MRFFAICPRIRKDAGCVVATTAWRVRVALLGTLYRQVVIDPAAERISVRSRYLWVFPRRRSLRFSDVQAVTYGYEEHSPGAFLSYAHNSYDCFSVGLRLYDDTELQLFNFYGDGSFSNNGPFPDWVYWDDFAFDMTGSQEQESRVFVDLLSRMIGVTVVPPRQY